MARPCTICTGGRRAEVDAALAAGQVSGQIARNTGHPRTTIERHAANCAPRAMALAASVVGLGDLISGAGLTAEAADLQRRTIAILAEAEGARRLPLALAAIREARGNLELLGKFTGKLRPDSQVNIAILNHPAFLAVQEGLLGWAKEDPSAAPRIAAILASATGAE